MSEYTLDPALEEKLSAMNIAELRKTAKLYGVSLSREMTTEDIKAAIRFKKSRQNISDEADTSKAPAPGRWRIIVHKTSHQGIKAGSQPAHVRVNGVSFYMPRNVPVDVPEKVVRALENSFHYEAVERDDGTTAMEAQLTYPFQIITFTPGPDPSPGYEKAKAGYYARREAYRNEFGYFPKNQAQLREAEEKGLISSPRRKYFNKEAAED